MRQTSRLSASRPAHTVNPDLPSAAWPRLLINQFKAVRFNASARLEDAYFPEMRVFGRDAAETAPHAADEVCDLGLGFRNDSVQMGLGYMINTQPGPNGRSASSVTWAGIYNTYYWLDPQKRVAGVFLTQILPFADTKAVALYGEFERGVYNALKSA